MRAHKSRLLFVGSDPTWLEAATEAARRRSAVLDVQPDMKGALSWMLQPERGYSHVLAVAPLRPKAMDALAGMLDEVTLQPTPLLLLGCTACGTRPPTLCVPTPDPDAIAEALGRTRESPPDLPPMQGSEVADTLYAGGLRMRFQPILRADTLKPIALEALARLHHDRRGIVHPRDFMPPTVASGRERILTIIAAARTFLDIAVWLRGTGLFVTINVPLTTVMHPLSFQRGVELCTVAGTTPGDIMIEVLETPAAPDPDQLRTALMRWREAGFRIAIDDAGPALPHWRDLLALPFDALKLDGRLVSDPSQRDLLASIVAQAREHGRFIVAEGVEDQDCLDRVRSLGVDAVQGFLFSRPLPALAVPIWLSQWKGA